MAQYQRRFFYAIEREGYEDKLGRVADVLRRFESEAERDAYVDGADNRDAISAIRMREVRWRNDRPVVRAWVMRPDNAPDQKVEAR